MAELCEAASKEVTPDQAVRIANYLCNGNYAVSGGIQGIEAVERLAKSFKARWGRHDGGLQGACCLKARWGPAGGPCGWGLPGAPVGLGLLFAMCFPTGWGHSSSSMRP